MGWAELAPAPLLHLYEKRLEGTGSPFEKGRRLEAAAAFAELSGLTQDAERLAGVLSGLDSQFATRWQAARERLREE